ncbi:rhodanese-like domain-containing protein [Nocardia shimofusensis]|uniref:rhodanese-like domain-containing protein n=1 Tax=Nocardia shimofusensis TaxID=228596 RepID=UPI00082CAB26|nr:rhodanese-like domain-containing protein [Nocardia shimofusensis]
MANDNAPMSRAPRTRTGDPQNVPRPVEGEADLVTVETTWGELQPLQCAAGVPTVGELEVIELVRAGARLVDTRVPDSRGGVSLPGALNVPHGEIVERRGELDPAGTTVVFCNGPQCPQSPTAIRELIEAGHPAAALAYYRGGLHDWITLGLPVEHVD